MRVVAIILGLMLAATPLSAQAPVAPAVPSTTPVTPVVPQPSPSAVAAAPAIAGPDTGNTGQPIFFDVSATVSATPPDLDVASGPADVALTTSYDSAGTKPTFVRAIFDTPGTYQFAVVATGTTGKPRVYAFKSITITSPAAPPTPPPSPPNPPPSGFAGNVYVTLIYAKNAADSTSDLRLSTIGDDVAKLNGRWGAFDTTSETGVRFASHTAIDGVPTVYLTDDAGTILGKVKSPGGRSDVIAKLTRLRKGER